MTAIRDTVVIRAATRDDVPDIIDVCTSSIGEGEAAGFGGPSAGSPFGSVVNLLQAWREPNLVGERRVFVAEVEGRLVGCVSIEEKADEIELVDIDVTLPYQGQGVGTRMVQFVEEYAGERAKRAVTLGTSRNAAGVPWKSLPWWLRRGYKVTHEEENEWTRSIGPVTKEIRMRKPVGNENSDRPISDIDEMR